MTRFVSFNSGGIGGSWDLVKKFTFDWSAHGFAHILEQAPVWRGVYWALLVSAAIFGFVYLALESIGTFINRDTTTTVKITSYTEVDFPAITFCNAEAFSKNFLDEDVMTKDPDPCCDYDENTIKFGSLDTEDDYCCCRYQGVLCMDPQPSERAKIGGTKHTKGSLYDRYMWTVFGVLTEHAAAPSAYELPCFRSGMLREGSAARSSKWKPGGPDKDCPPEPGIKDLKIVEWDPAIDGGAGWEWRAPGAPAPSEDHRIMDADDWERVVEALDGFLPSERQRDDMCYTRDAILPPDDEDDSGKAIPQSCTWKSSPPRACNPSLFEERIDQTYCQCGSSFPPTVSISIPVPPIDVLRVLVYTFF